MSWIIDALAVFRLTRLTVSDTLFDKPREQLLDRLDDGGPFARKLGEGLACAWCCSVWWAFAAIGFRRLFPRAWRVLADGLALSAAAGLLSGHEYAK